MGFDGMGSERTPISPGDDGGDDDDDYDEFQ